MLEEEACCDSRRGVLISHLCNRYLVGVYHVETEKFVTGEGLMGIWPQAVLQALALNHMADKSQGRHHFIPLFAGDFNKPPGAA